MQRLLPSSATRGRGGIDAWAARLYELFDVPIARATIKPGAESVDVRRFAVQVVARDGSDVRKGATGTNRFLVRVWISTTNFGAPAGTQTVSVATGTLHGTIVANREFEVITDDAGLCALDVEVSGAGARFVMAMVLGEIDSSGSVAWAA